jgi:hypothetical protein
MAETFKFVIPDPGSLVDENEVASVRLYESSDGLSNWALVDSELVINLTDNLDGTFTWASALSDAAYFHKLVAVDANGQEAIQMSILPPRANPTLCTIQCSTVDILGVATEGIDFEVQLYGTRVQLGGSLVSLDAHKFDTDMNGLFSIQVLKGAKINVTSELLGKRTVTIDTTDRDFIDLAVE